MSFLRGRDSDCFCALYAHASWLRAKTDPVHHRLYFLPADIHEDVNLFFKYPDEVRRLRSAADAFDHEVSQNRRPAGRAPSVTLP